MSSARTLLATAAVSAALLLSAPAAYAAEPDRDHGGSSVSQDHDSSRDHGHDGNDKKHEKDDSFSGKHDKREHDKPKGGMHTGGGALAGPTVTTGGLAVLAVAGTGLYAARRRKAATNMA